MHFSTERLFQDYYTSIAALCNALLILQLAICFQFAVQFM